LRGSSEKNPKKFVKTYYCKLAKIIRRKGLEVFGKFSLGGAYYSLDLHFPSEFACSYTVKTHTLPYLPLVYVYVDVQEKNKVTLNKNP
jgi:hypothetical protein